MTTQFPFQPDKGTLALTLMAASPPTLIMTGPLYAQGLISSLVAAEWLAAQCGVVPFVEIEGQRGIAQVGGARVRMQSETPPDGVPPELYEGVRTIYLAAHGAARRATNATTISTTPANPLAEMPPPIGAIPVAVWIACVAIAAVIAGAKYASDAVQESIRVDGETARANARMKLLSDAASKVFDATGTIPREFWEGVAGEAHAEAAKPGKPVDWFFAGGVALGLGALGTAAYVFLPRGLLRGPS